MTKKQNPETGNFAVRKRKDRITIQWGQILDPVLPLKLGKPVVIPTPEGENSNYFRRKLYQALLNRLDGLKEAITGKRFSLVVRDNVLGPERTTEVILIQTRKGE